MTWLSVTEAAERLPPSARLRHLDTIATIKARKVARQRSIAYQQQRPSTSSGSSIEERRRNEETRMATAKEKFTWLHVGACPDDVLSRAAGFPALRGQERWDALTRIQCLKCLSWQEFGMCVLDPEDGLIVCGAGDCTGSLLDLSADGWG